jgi:hypothetical protein
MMRKRGKIARFLLQNKAMQIRCVAVIGKKNDPLYIKTFHKDSSRDEDLFRGEDSHYHFLIHMSLDYVDEKWTQKYEESTGLSQDTYLGLLHDLEDLRIYGWITTTLIKFIIIVEASLEPKEAEIRSILLNIYDLYIQVVSNAFYSVGDIRQPITSEKFNRGIQTIVEQYQ